MSGAIVQDEELAFRRYFWGLLTILPGGMVAGLVFRYFSIYATDHLLIAPAVVGSILAAKAIFDGLTDPLVGWWSDRQNAPRRLPFLRWGGLATFSVLGLFFPPEGLSGVGLVAWLLVFVVLWETGQTMRGVSTAALGLEVATNARRRSLMTAIFAIPGFIGAVLGILAMQYAMNAADPRAVLWPLLIGATSVWAATVEIAVRKMRELPKPHRTEERPPWRMVREVVSNRYHRHFIAIQLSGTLAFTSLAFAIPYVTKYAFERPDMTIFVFLLFLGASAFTSPLWFKVIARLGVKRTWMAGLYIWLAVLVSYPLALLTGIYGFLILAFLAGAGNGAARCTSFALLGDIADYDARESGRQRQGVYATLYGLVDKIGSAAGIFLLGWALQMSGFVPNEPQTTTVLVAIAITVSVIPAIGIALAIRLLGTYRFYEEQGVWDGKRMASQAEEALATPA